MYYNNEKHLQICQYTFSFFILQIYFHKNISLYKKSFYSLVLSASESLSGYPQWTAPLRSLKFCKSLFKKILLVKYVTQDWLYSFRLWIARAERSFKSPSRLGLYLLTTGEKCMVVVLKMRKKKNEKKLDKYIPIYFHIDLHTKLICSTCSTFSYNYSISCSMQFKYIDMQSFRGAFFLIRF